MSIINLKKDDNIALITINRPNALNALSSFVISELIDLIAKLDRDKEISAIVLTGSGEKSFIAGADIKEMKNFSKDEANNYCNEGQKLTVLIEELSKPVIAAINGYALGGGCEIAMACHVRYASENAILGQPEVGLGLIAGFGGTQRLPRLIGKGNALELLCSAKTINAHEALKLGLVNKVFDKDLLIKESCILAKKIASMSPLAVMQTIKSVNNGLDRPICDGLLEEKNRFANLFSTSDTKEGLTAFIEKRKPRFLGK